MLRFYLLVGVVSFISFPIIYGLLTIFANSAQKKRMRKAIEATRQRQETVWKETKAITDMVSLYMAIVCKHSPDSEEAQAFRFGIDSRLIQELYGDNDAMVAFNQQCDIIDATYRKRDKYA
jgi:hypothetical protein